MHYHHFMDGPLEGKIRADPNCNGYSVLLELIPTVPQYLYAKRELAYTESKSVEYYLVSHEDDHILYSCKHRDKILYYITYPGGQAVPYGKTIIQTIKNEAPNLPFGWDWLIVQVAFEVFYLAPRFTNPTVKEQPNLDLEEVIKELAEDRNMLAESLTILKNENASILARNHQLENEILRYRHG